VQCYIQRDGSAGITQSFGTTKKVFLDRILLLGKAGASPSVKKAAQEFLRDLVKEWLRRSDFSAGEFLQLPQKPFERKQKELIELIPFALQRWLDEVEQTQQMSKPA